MKRTLYISFLALMVSCSGTVDETDNTQNIPDEFVAPFTLSVDKQQVEADGVDFVTFSLKDTYGREMLADKKTLQNVKITSSRTGRLPSLQTTASFIDNGVHVFTAAYFGTQSSNTVEVTAVNRAAYEVFHKNVGLFKATSVWCVACPSLGESLHGLSQDAADHSVVLAFHGNFNAQVNGPDPFSVYAGDTALGDYLLGYFGGQGWPTLVYDLSTAVTGSAGTVELQNKIYERRAKYPATCGIKVSSVALEGTQLKVSAAVKTSTGGDYDLACAVLADGLEFSGGYSVGNKGVYDEVVLTLTGNFLTYNSESGMTLEKDGELEKEFVFDFGEGNVPSETVLNNMYVAVWAHKRNGDVSRMDNIVTCDYGKTVGYRYNE